MSVATDIRTKTRPLPPGANAKCETVYCKDGAYAMVAAYDADDEFLNSYQTCILHRSAIAHKLTKEVKQ